MAYHGKINNRDILYIYKELNHGCTDAVHIHTHTDGAIRENYKP